MRRGAQKAGMAAAEMQAVIPVAAHRTLELVVWRLLIGLLSQGEERGAEAPLQDMAAMAADCLVRTVQVTRDMVARKSEAARLVDRLGRAGMLLSAQEAAVAVITAVDLVTISIGAAAEDHHL